MTLSAKDVIRGDYLAQGRFGKVYKGRLKGLVDVAIKYQYVSGADDIKVLVSLQLFRRI